MAKRRRLTPTSSPMAGPDGPLETKAMFPLGLAPRATPPIAVEAARASSEAALQEMAEVLHDAREGGRMIVSLPLDAVVADHLVRDRIALDPEDLAVLRASIEARGQQVPIEVTRLEEGRYGLISGLRRLTALRALHGHDPEGGFGRVQALLRQPQDAAQAYLAMVEENEIRAGLSYYERARIALRAVEQGAFENSKAALLQLYAAASRAKRSKIRSFLTIVEAFDDVLRHPATLAERQGLRLAKALAADPGLAARLRDDLSKDDARDAQAEAAIISRALEPASPSPAPPRGSEVALHRAGQVLTLEGPGVTDALERAVERLLRDLAPDVSRAKHPVEG